MLRNISHAALRIILTLEEQCGYVRLCWTRSTTGQLGWVLVQFGEASVRVYVNNEFEDCIGFHSAAVIDVQQSLI
jgi:hypothetical protein